MNFIDTHCHLELADYDSDREQVIQRSRSAEVSKMITVGSSLECSKNCIELTKQYEDVFATIGVHPHDAERLKRCGDWEVVWQEQLQELEVLLVEDRIVGIGECGLDYSRSDVDKALQRKVFEDHLALALKYDKPVVLHIRDAYEDAESILKNVSGIRAVAHCFIGTLECAKRYIEQFGHFLSFTGIVTFGDDKIGELVEVVKYVPKERIMVETDAPYLAPPPYRGKRNEPAYVVEVAKTVARIRGEKLEEVAEYTTANAEEFFQFSHHYRL